MKCGKCGQSLGKIGDYLTHACAPKPEAERRQLSPLQQEAQEEETRRAHLSGLDRDIELANQRDFGPGQERDNRFGDNDRAVEREQLDGTRVPIRLGRTGSAIEIEAVGGRTPTFDADAEVPTDPYERVEFEARMHRFPREQLTAIGDRPWDKGMTSYQLTPAELDEYLRTGKLPEIPEERKHHPDLERQIAAQAPAKTEGPSL